MPLSVPEVGWPRESEQAFAGVDMMYGGQDPEQARVSRQ